jgi:hypothetical protein
MTIFTLGNTTFPITPEREVYNTLRLKYQNLAETAKQDFIDHFDERFQNLDHLIANCTLVAQEYLDYGIDIAIRDLVTFDVMDIGDEYFIKHYLMHWFNWEADFKVIGDKYLEIVLNPHEFNKYKSTNDGNSGGVIGGGFGLEGATQGFVIAAATNLALSLAHGVVSELDKAVNSIGETHKKSKIFKDPHTKNYLSDCIYQLVFKVHYAVIDAINDRQPNRLSGNVSEEDYLKAKSLLENISKGRITGDQSDALLIDALILNPYEPELYYFWLNRHNDADGKLQCLAEYFGVQSLLVRKREIDLVARTFECVVFDTVEAAQIAQFESEDKKIRTYNGELYDTTELAMDAKLVHEEEDRKSRTVNGVEYTSKDEADVHRDKFAWAIAIFLLPLPLAFKTFDNGYSLGSRIIAMIWLPIGILIQAGIIALMSRGS